MRAVVACGWFGIQAWIGGEALNTFFTSILPGWHDLLGAGFSGHSTTEWISFILFWSLNVYVVYRGMDLLRAVENWAAPFVLVMTAVLLAWAVTEAHGLGPLLSQPGRFPTLGAFLPVFVPSLTAMIGYWATLSLNMPDFTRFGRSQREQVIGQTVALPTTMFVFAAMGVLITSATTIIYGEVIWDPIKLVGRFSSPLVIAISMFTAVVATLAVNIAANVVSPANDFANAFPRLIKFKTGGLITGVLGIIIQPWRLARRSVGLHLRLAARLLGRARLDRGRADRRLLDRAATAAVARGSVSHDGALRPVERRRRLRHARRLRGSLGGLDLRATSAALQLRVVRRLRCGGRGIPCLRRSGHRDEMDETLVGCILASGPCSTGFGCSPAVHFCWRR